MRRTAVLLTVIAIAAAPAALCSQETNGDAPRGSAASAPEHFYKLSLVVEQTNEAGKIVNARTFVETIPSNAGGLQSIRTGDRVPVSTGENVFQYIDMGVRFDISQVKETGNNLSFRLGAEVSSFAKAQGSPGDETANLSQPSTGEGAASHPVIRQDTSRPVIRQNKWDSSVLIPVGKPAVVFSADNLNDKGKVQVEVTATKLD